jgi:hypothetical protein
MRTIIASCVLVVFGLGAVVADDFMATVTKIEKKDDGYLITGKKGKKGDAKEITYTIATTVKVNKGKAKFDKDTKKLDVEVGDVIADGFKDEMFSKVSMETPVQMYLTTDTSDKVTKVVVIAGKKKKGT